MLIIPSCPFYMFVIWTRVTKRNETGFAARNLYFCSDFQTDIWLLSYYNSAENRGPKNVTGTRTHERTNTKSIILVEKVNTSLFDRVKNIDNVNHLYFWWEWLIVYHNPWWSENSRYFVYDGTSVCKHNLVLLIYILCYTLQLFYIL